MLTHTFETADLFSTENTAFPEEPDLINLGKLQVNSLAFMFT